MQLSMYKLFYLDIKQGKLNLVNFTHQFNFPRGTKQVLSFIIFLFKDPPSHQRSDTIIPHQNMLVNSFLKKI